MGRAIEERRSVVEARPARRSLERAGLEPRDIDLIIYATLSPTSALGAASAHRRGCGLAMSRSI
jgi:3-oxoacyl-[acyl-carrier-protein] synthase III